MRALSVGRNDPCPCLSGKKFKHCCLGKENSAAPDQGAASASDILRNALQGQQFNSLEEAPTFVARQDRKSGRVGTECVSTCRSRWSPYHKKKKTHTITENEL